MRSSENMHAALDLQVGNDDGPDGGRRLLTDGRDGRNGLRLKSNVKIRRPLRGEQAAIDFASMLTPFWH